jgi:glycosyltransferase involved in cell wall biosynthesis
MYKEQDNALLLVGRVFQSLSDYAGQWELLCVDDGSPDDTVAQLKEAQNRFGSQLRVIELQRNYGQTAAMQAGIDAAVGELIATMDGYLQNDPQDIPRMVKELLDRDLDMLQGWRKDRQDAALKRKLPSRIANHLIAKITGVKLHDYGCSLKVYRSHIIKQVRLFGEMHRFIPVWMASITTPQRIGETPVNHHARQFGESKYNLTRTFRVIIDLISVFFFLNFRARPGHFFGSMGLVTGFAGSLLMSWLLIVKFVMGEDIGGRPLLIVAVMLLLSALQLITTGVVAEMLSRIFYQQNDTRRYNLRSQDPPADFRSPPPPNGSQPLIRLVDKEQA